MLTQQAVKTYQGFLIIHGIIMPDKL